MPNNQSDQSNCPRINFNSAEFLTSAAKLVQCPDDTGVEIAFAGRSNAGKSSALNTLTNRNKLARTSKTPGRTQLINFFKTNLEDFNLVDLPGYGYAKVSLEQKNAWQRHLSQYMEERNALKGLVLLVDIRHELKEFDHMIINWAIDSGMPLHILLTKCDKLKKGPANSAVLKVRKELSQHKDQITVQAFSSLKRTGVDILQQRLQGLYEEHRGWDSEE